MKFPRTIFETVAQQRQRAAFRAIHRRFRDWTMIHRRTYVDTLVAAAEACGVEGDVVECGVWRGGMAAGLCSVLGPQRAYHLFDSFEGLPPAQEIDGPRATAWQQDTGSAFYNDNCSAPPEYAAEVMSLAGATNVQLVKGWFEDTLPGFECPRPIAVLHLDADWYDSTKVCLENLFDKLAPGGVVVVDDYFHYDGCSRAVHDFLSDRSSTMRVHSLGNVCFLRKREHVTPAGA